VTARARSAPIGAARLGAALVLGGVAAYVGTVVVAGALTPGYRSARQLISELGATGAPFSDLVGAMLVGVGAIAVAFAHALRREPALASPIGRGLLAALGGSLVLGGIFRCDPQCAPRTAAGWLHLVTAAPGAVACLVAPFVFAHHLARGGWRRRARVSFGFGLASLLAHAALFALAPALDCVGLGQRLATAVPLAWLTCLASWALRPVAPEDRFPPGPGLLETLGRLRERARPLAMLRRLARAHGGVVGVRGLGARAVVVTDPARIEELFVRNAKRLTQWGMSQFGPVLGQGMLTADGETWRRHRRLLQPLFRERSVPRHAPRIAQVAARIFDATEPGRVDVHALSVRAATEVANALLFASDSEAIARRFARTQEHIMRHFARSVTGLPLPLWLPTRANRALMRSVRALDAALGARIARRRREGGPGDDFLGTLLSSELDDRAVRDECVTMLLAASETTASGLSWTLHLLATHPDVQRRLARAVRDEVGDDAPTAEHLERLPEVRRVLLEALRLYTPVWAIGRVATDEVTLGAHRLPAGTTIFAVPALAHRDAFDGGFEPDRWRCPHALKQAGARFRPFGAGPRKCIGEHLGMLELSILLVAVLQRWDLAPAEAPDVLPTVTLRPADGLVLELTPR